MLMLIVHLPAPSLQVLQHLKDLGVPLASIRASLAENLTGPFNKGLEGTLLLALLSAGQQLEANAREARSAAVALAEVLQELQQSEPIIRKEGLRLLREHPVTYFTSPHALLQPFAQVRAQGAMPQHVVMHQAKLACHLRCCTCMHALCMFGSCSFAEGLHVLRMCFT